jgi:subtilisin family serine protease
MVVNLSLGMDIESTVYNVLDEGVRRATAHGIHVVVSAGNAASDSRTFSPAHVSEALTVGAYGPTGNFSTFSNAGASVDLLAPGDLIASLSNDPADEAANFAVIESGTSMAAGHVTGAVALLLAANPNAQPQFVRQTLIGSSVPTVAAVHAVRDIYERQY